MLRILNTKNSVPKNYFVQSLQDCPKFHPGQLASLYKKNNEVYCGLSDGFYTAGIIDDIRDSSIGDDSTAGTNRITVWDSPGLICQTDQFSTTDTYIIGQNLYTGNDGKFTSIKNYDFMRPIAKIIDFKEEILIHIPKMMLPLEKIMLTLEWI